MEDDLAAIVSEFRIPGDHVATARFGAGHINDTFLLTSHRDGISESYLLQRINHEVFTDVPALMDNVARVCGHIRSKLSEQGVSDVDRRCLTLVSTRDGLDFHHDTKGRYWRVFRLIEGATGRETVESPSLAEAAARAFGSFLYLLDDLPGARLHETIPDFHHTPKRFEALEAAIEADLANRACLAKPEIDWALDHRAMASALLDLHAQGLVPERTTHNDTKLNNVLMDDATDEAVCVIDLDTVMPGLSLYDFGDLVRTCTSPTDEDERDTSKVTMRMPMFEALVRGYLSSAGPILTPTEIQSLPLAGMVMTMTIGLRFLTDFLRGDVYYRTTRPGQNLDRCRTQFALVDSMEAQREAMERFVRSIGR